MMDEPRTSDFQPWKVFKVTDCDWWIARTLAEAIEDCKRQCGFDDSDFREARELTEGELDRLTYIEDMEAPRKEWVRRTFREELARRSANEWDLKPGMFASTEF
jgi:hypothetical protein